jgi:hypothetical protein
VTEKVRLSKGQRAWLKNEIMWGTYECEEFYMPLFNELVEGQEVTELVPLKNLMEGVEDRVNYGDRDPAAYRDRGFAQRILAKIYNQ